MMTVEDALSFADRMYTPASFAGVLAAEVRRLREENERLRGWIRVEGSCNDTCTRQILGEVCQGCKCGKDAARGAK